MAFAGKVWRLLVGIKDGLSLVFLLLFFGLLFMVLAARPSPAQVRDGALLLDLDGYVVEEKSKVDPFSMLLTGAQPVQEFDVQQLVHAIDAAAKDKRIKAVVLDLSRFMGGGQVHMEEIGAALDRVRAAKKPVFAYATAYADDAMMLAAHSSEVWVDPLGGAVIAGPGGNHLYYKGLLDKLKVNARVYRVGTYKSAVEPYLRSDMSDPARENYQALYGALWSEWKANVTKARPKLQVEKVTTDPVGWVEAAKGDFATAAKQGGLVDRIGDRVEFGQRVAEVVGEDEWDASPGAYAHSDYAPWLADNPMPTRGKAIGVVTIAGEIVDGDAGPGTAGGDRIAQLLDDALSDDIAALVVRVDSPGGSVMASEEIRRAILRQKARGIPVVVSMANVAASGGYWVSTPGDRIFAEPDTVTGSIGIFAVVPTFEQTAAEFGLNSDGVRTTPLSGQPDLIAGFTPEVDTILQDTIENGYGDFLTRVAEARKMSTEQVDKIGQGRVWDGGAARQIGLVDQYGGLQDALEWAAQKAGLGKDDWHADYLGETPDNYDSLLRRMLFSSESRAPANDVFALTTRMQGDLLARVSSDLDRLLGTRGMQAYCLECPAPRPAASAPARAGTAGWLAQLARIWG
ncbi:MAG: signal peptide peptidase SppA [Rhodobacteraceae bacterium]|nr:signal peptide peptidase SppA [Paracoccaceae bacterium]